MRVEVVGYGDFVVPEGRSDEADAEGLTCGARGLSYVEQVLRPGGGGG